VAGTTNGDVKIRAGASATSALTVNNAITTTSGTTDIASGSVVLEAGGAILVSAVITTDSFGNAAAGDVFIHHHTVAAASITISANILARGGFTGVAGAASNGGAVTILNDQGAISIDATINVSKAAAGTNDG